MQLFNVCHSVLLSCLTAISITATLFQWLTSHLLDRQQLISIDGHRSCSVAFSCGVPRGSVLGPLLFMLPLGQIIRHHGLGFHRYSDNTHIYLTFQASTVFLLSYLQEVGSKLNTDNTEILLVDPLSFPNMTSPFTLTEL